MNIYFRKKSLAILLVVVLLIPIAVSGLPTAMAAGGNNSAATDFSGKVQEFLNPPDENRGGFRYMLPGGVIGLYPDWLDELEAELNEFHDMGYRIVEISMIQADVTYGVDSDAWRTVLRRLYEVSNDIGMTVHLHMGWNNSGTPFILVGNDSTKDEDFRKTALLSSSTVAVAGGASFEAGELKLVGKAAVRDSKANKPVAVLAIQYEMNGTAKKQINVRQLNLSDFTVSYGDLTGTATNLASADGVAASATTCDFILTYTGSEKLTIGKAGETWDVIAYNQIVHPGNTSRSSVSTNPVTTVDYFSTVSAQAHIDTYMNKVFKDPDIIAMVKENGANFGGGFMYDGADGSPSTSATTWTGGLPEKFKSFTGYDLLDYLGVIYSSYTLDTGDAVRIADDKLAVLSELYYDYLTYMSDWAASMNSIYTHQAGFSVSVETSRVMMGVMEPQTETLDFQDGVGNFLVVTSAGRMAGRTIFPCELGAMLNTAYGADLNPLVRSVNIALLAGVNQMLIHTGSYKYALDAKWPGFDMSYMQIPHFSNTLPLWVTMDSVADYIGRGQYLMQNGTARRDVGIYLHAWTNEQHNSSDYRDLMSYGYTFDYFNPAMMATPAAQKIENGVFDPDGGAYKAFVVDAATTNGTFTNLLNGNRFSTAASNVLLSYAQAGIPIIVVGSIPSDVESFNDSKEELSRIWNAIAATGNLSIVATQSQLGPKLIELGIKANAINETPSNVANFMRSTDVADFYFLYNRGDSFRYTFPNKHAVNAPISFKGTGQPYLMNLWTGEVTKISDYTVKDGYVTINVALATDQATVVAITKEPTQGIHITNVSGNSDFSYDAKGALIMNTYENGTYNIGFSDGSNRNVEVTGVAAPVTLKSGWTLRVESWTAKNGYASIGVPATETAKTWLNPVRLDDLISWRNIESVGVNVSGIGEYSIKFTLNGDYDGAKIALGKVFDTALVYINGKQVIVDQLALTADLGVNLKPSGEENELKIMAPSGLINTLRYYGATIHNSGRDPNLPALDYGLFGPVVVTPYVQSNVALNVLADIRADQASVAVNNPASYTVSLDNTKGVGIAELSFTFDGYVLDKDSITAIPLNGFALGIYPDLTFQYMGSGIWKGTVKYMYFGNNFVGVDGPLDILKISGTAIATGPATITLSSFTVSGSNGSAPGPMPSFIRTAEATADIGLKPAVYSKYDLNKDGSIDETDLLYLVYFYQWNDRDAGWDTIDLYGIFAKDCDFQVNGKVDLADMIELTANYGIYDPYV